MDRETEKALSPDRMRAAKWLGGEAVYDQERRTLLVPTDAASVDSLAALIAEVRLCATTAERDRLMGLLMQVFKPRAIESEPAEGS